MGRRCEFCQKTQGFHRYDCHVEQAELEKIRIVDK